MDCSLFDIVHRPQKTLWFGELSLLIAMHLAEHMSTGIAYMHEKRLVHADLKSSNILIDHTSSSELVPKICDFGHAAVRTHPASHHRCGTPHWAAPEALRSEAIGPRSDVFSWGVMLWEMLAQTLPHSHLTFAQIVGTVGWSGFLPEMELLPPLPPGLHDYLLLCLRFSPYQRPRAKELGTQLRHIKRRARRAGLGMLSGFLEGGA
jgi:serine/threonine protein kinase